MNRERRKDGHEKQMNGGRRKQPIKEKKYE